MSATQNAIHTIFFRGPSTYLIVQHAVSDLKLQNEVAIQTWDSLISIDLSAMPTECKTFDTYSTVNYVQTIQGNWE